MTTKTIAEQANEYAAKVMYNVLEDLLPGDMIALVQSMIAMAWVEGSKAGAEETADIYRRNA